MTLKNTSSASSSRKKSNTVEFGNGITEYLLQQGRCIFYKALKRAGRGWRGELFVSLKKRNWQIGNSSIITHCGTVEHFGLAMHHR